MQKRIIAVIILWLFVVGSSLVWNVLDEKNENRLLAFALGRAFFAQIVIDRSWNAFHGGVYVPVSPETQPNPYLQDPLRDLVTDKKIRLTKINPAYMTRQISEIASKNEYGIQFHITSLNPIRPENKATEWEKKWLNAFENGEKEKGEFVGKGQTSFFRYMAPLLVEEGCLKCHAKQGYRKGDIRGGISVILPQFSEEKINIRLLAGYGTAALFGLAIIVIGGLKLEKERVALLASNQSLETEISGHRKTIGRLKEAREDVQTLSGIIPICMHCKEIRDDKGYWNKLEKFISEHSKAEFSHSICEKCMEKYHSDLED